MQDYPRNYLPFDCRFASLDNNILQCNLVCSQVLLFAGQNAAGGIIDQIL